MAVNGHQAWARLRNDEAFSRVGRYDGHHIPMLCECGNGDCRSLLWIAEQSWAAIRVEQGQFISTPEHVEADTVVVRRENGFVVVRSR